MIFIFLIMLYNLYKNLYNIYKYIMKRRKNLYEALELSKIIYDDNKSFCENMVNYLVNKSLLNILKKKLKIIL